MIGYPARLFPSWVLTSIVASDNGFDLPPFQFFVEHMAVYSDLAHERLKQLVDGV